MGIVVSAEDEDLFKRGLDLMGLDKHLRKMTIKPLKNYITDKYSGSKRAHYLKCFAELDTFGFVHGVYYPAFVKWFERQSAFRTHRYRAIVPMVSKAKGVSGVTEEGQELFIGIAAGLQPNNLIECCLHKLRNLNRTHKFASGHDQFRRAEEIIENMEPGWKCIGIDAKAFDGSLNIVANFVRLFLIKLFWRCHPRWMASREGQWFQHSELQQMRMKIKTKFPTLYGVIFGNRGSGTPGTADQNKCIMAAFIEGFFEQELAVGTFRYYCDGDDTLMFLSPQFEWSRFEDFLLYTARLGVTIQVETISQHWSEIVFCRAKIVEVDGRHRLVKKPFDAFVSMCALGRHFKAGTARHGHLLQDYMKTLNVGFSIMWQGVPVMSHMAAIYGEKGFLNPGLLLGATGLEYTMRESLQHDEAYQRAIWQGDKMVKRTKYNICRKPITMRSRMSFFQTFGIPIAQQIRLENHFDAIGERMHLEVDAFVTQRNKRVKQF